MLSRELNLHKYQFSPKMYKTLGAHPYLGWGERRFLVPISDLGGVTPSHPLSLS